MILVMCVDLQPSIRARLQICYGMKLVRCCNSKLLKFMSQNELILSCHTVCELEKRCWNVDLQQASFYVLVWNFGGAGGTLQQEHGIGNCIVSSSLGKQETQSKPVTGHNYSCCCWLSQQVCAPGCWCNETKTENCHCKPTVNSCGWHAVLPV